MHTQHTPETKYFELRDDLLSVRGGHPRRGDICAAVEDEEVEGELYIVQADSHVYAGRLHRKGGSVILRYPNGTSTTLNGTSIEAVYRITQFFYAQGTLAKPKLRRTARKTAPVVFLTDWRTAHHPTA